MLLFLSSLNKFPPPPYSYFPLILYNPSPFISFQVHIIAYHRTLTYLTADTLPHKQLHSDLCCPHSSSVSYLSPAAGHTISPCSSQGFNSVVLFLSTQICTFWCFVLRGYHCRCLGCGLCNTNSGCYHNDQRLLMLLQLLCCGWPQPVYFHFCT